MRHSQQISLKLKSLLKVLPGIEASLGSFLLSRKDILKMPPRFAGKPGSEKNEKIENFNLKAILGLWWRQVVEWSLPTPEVRGSNPSNYIECSQLIVSAFYGYRCISEDWVWIPLF